MVGLKYESMIIMFGVLSRITSFKTHKVALTRLYAQTLLREQYIFNPQSNLSMAKTGKSSSPVPSMFRKMISPFCFLFTFQMSFFKLWWNSTYILHMLKQNKRYVWPSVCYVPSTAEEVRQQLTGWLLSH